MAKEFLLVAGEASGDQHGAELLQELRGRVPDLRCFGLGGDQLQAEGLESIGHSAEVAVVGVTEALKILPRARQLFREILRQVEERGTRLAVLIDFAEFNLRLARELHKRGVRVIYYISPQLWAWRRGRVKTISRVVEEVLVLFPFEDKFYRDHGVRVTHVGHPLVDQVPELQQIWDGEGERVPLRERSELRPFHVALLPGSRPSEVERLLPTMCAAAKHLAQSLPVRFQLIQAPTIKEELLRRILADFADGLDLEVVRYDRFEAIAGSHLAICASGTATLEVGLLGTPMIVVYRLSRWTARIARFLVKLPHYSLANLVLGERAVPELLQDAGHPEAIAQEASELLTHPDRIVRQRHRLASLRQRLGRPGASARAAEVVAAYLGEEVAAGGAA